MASPQADVSNGGEQDESLALPIERAAQHHSPLLNLPAELQVAIYEGVVVSETPIKIEKAPSAEEPALLAVSKQVREAALPLYYAKNSFAVDLEPSLELVRATIDNEDLEAGRTSYVHLLSWLMCIGKKKAGMIRKVELQGTLTISVLRSSRDDEMANLICRGFSNAGVKMSTLLIAVKALGHSLSAGLDAKGSEIMQQEVRRMTGRQAAGEPTENWEMPKGLKEIWEAKPKQAWSDEWNPVQG